MNQVSGAADVAVQCIHATKNILLLLWLLAAPLHIKLASDYDFNFSL